MSIDVDRVNEQLEHAPAEERVSWALNEFAGHIVLQSSFGAQAAVSLHMVTRESPHIPVVLIDTGYLFPETYRFIDQLTERLALNVRVYRADMSPAWQEARFGKLWEQGVEGIERYNTMNKVEPMERALEELDVRASFAGLRRQQSRSRSKLPVVVMQNGRYKVHPLIDWTDKHVYDYLTEHQLPYHPLWEQGYVSIGDWHTTSPLKDGMTEEETRFFGLKRECGLHDYSI